MPHTMSISSFLRGSALLLCLGSASLASAQANADTPGQPTPSEATPSAKPVVPRRSASKPTTSARARHHKTTTAAKAPASTVTNAGRPNVSHDTTPPARSTNGALSGSDWQTR